MAVLRDFARLRMVIGNLASGRSAQATRLGDEIKTPAVAAAATAFLDSYRTSRSIIQACRDLTAYAEAHPAVVELPGELGLRQPVVHRTGCVPIGELKSGTSRSKYEGRRC